MSDTIYDLITEQNAQLEAAKQHFEASENSLKSALNTLSKANKIALKIQKMALGDNIKSQPSCDVPITEHRMKHRPGRPAKIDQDPELEAFLMERIHRLGFVQMADEVAKHFPQDRRVGKSAIHAWYKRRLKHSL